MDNFWANDIAITKGGTAAVVFKSPIGSDVEPSRVLAESDNETGEIAGWGSNNDYPQQFLKKIRKNGAALSGLKVLRKAHYGSGFVLVKETYEEGKRVFEPQSISQHSDINEFWKKSQMKRFHKEIIADLEYWWMAFPEFILSKDYKRINSVRRQKTAHCRFELMNKETGFIKHCYISAHWDLNPELDGPLVQKVPLIDSYWTAEQVKDYCRKNRIRKFIIPQFYPLIDESYYPKPDWHSVHDNGWIDVANSIPEFKKSMFERQINIKFVIEVAEEYFENEYGEDWEKYTPEKRQEIADAFVTKIDETLRDNKNAGRSLLTKVYRGNNGEAINAIKVTTIDNNLKDGSYLPEASAANSEILFALGVDPTLIGAGIPGGKLGAGSGSDKREAFLLLAALLKSNRDTTLETFDFIKQYNEWPDELHGSFEDTVLTTLDKNPTGKQNQANL